MRNDDSKKSFLVEIKRRFKADIHVKKALLRR
jgi:hypothetical protein